jgi:hypothetical protein
VTRAALGFAIAVAVCAQDRKSLPNQAGNDEVELAGAVLLDRAQVREALGADLGAGYAAVRIKITPKTGRPMLVSPDDFTLLSRKDGERSSALSPGQIAGRGALIVYQAQRQPGGLGTMTNGPVWGGIGGAPPGRLPGQGSGVGNTSSVERGTVDSRVERDKNAQENPLLEVLKARALVDTETQDPVEGLLYFALEGKKVKPKDTSLLYKGAGGRLVMDFR